MTCVKSQKCINYATHFSHFATHLRWLSTPCVTCTSQHNFTLGASAYSVRQTTLHWHVNQLQTDKSTYSASRVEGVGAWHLSVAGYNGISTIAPLIFQYFYISKKLQAERRFQSTNLFFTFVYKFCGGALQRIY